MDPKNNPPVSEFRIAVTTQEYDRLVKFYCKGLGVEPTENWVTGESKAVLLEMGRASLEIFNEQQAEMVDQIEAGHSISGPIRFAIQVPDIEAAMERLLAQGALLVHDIVITPWGDKNVRIQDPDGMQITLFQVLKPSQ